MVAWLRISQSVRLYVGCKTNARANSSSKLTQPPVSSQSQIESDFDEMNKVTVSGRDLLKSFLLFILCICVTGLTLSLLERNAELEARMAHNRKSIRNSRRRFFDPESAASAWVCGSDDSPFWGPMYAYAFR